MYIFKADFWWITVGYKSNYIFDTSCQAQLKYKTERQISETSSPCDVVTRRSSWTGKEQTLTLASHHTHKSDDF
jgi:hypothetical protein